MGDFGSILDRWLNTCIAHKSFCMLTIKQLLGLVQPSDWFTTTDLKGTYFHVKVTLRHRKFLHSAFQQISNELPFGYSLDHCTFSMCVEVALQLLQNKDMRVYWRGYFIHHISSYLPFPSHISG